jgi:uncharacterized protein (DUF2062 family)|tara:strand:+ start:230 stop:727 length:498 start_codon:yes stop_codon:yes gene_type:complete
MIKNVIKRLFPKLDAVKEEKILKIFGPAVLQPNLWHINKKSVSRGFAIGAFCAFLPIPGQMIIAAFLSITFAANLPISVILTWISNPFTYTPIFYFAYKIGKIIINADINVDEKEIDILSNIKDIWEPLLLGSIILAIIGSIISYILIRVYWRYYVIKVWSKRKK